MQLHTAAGGRFHIALMVVTRERSVAGWMHSARSGHAQQVEIDYEAAQPPYRQIAAWLRGRIESGEFGPGRRLPAERQIMEELGVTATTARRALRVLAEEGLVVTTPGRGTHVARL